MSSYVLMWKNFFNFSGKTDRKNYWLAVLVNVIFTGLLEMIYSAVPNLEFLFDVYVVATLIPSISMMVRRLRDVKKHWANIFFMFLPVVGTIILLVYLCRGSAESEEK